MAAVVSTWPFSMNGLEKAVHALKASCSTTEAVEIGIRTVELDPTVTSAGYGGLPNAAGCLQLDGAIMTSDGALGAVMALEGYPTCIHLARLVMENSSHPILAGEGAKAFAMRHGLRPSSDLLTPDARKRYQEFLEENGAPCFHSDGNSMPHSDTVGMIARDEQGCITAACATSGMQFKAIGRVGDSPIVGAGLYADSAGAAVASGDGDKMLRFCLSFLVVERMRAGDNPVDACRYAVRRLHDDDSTCQAAVAAMGSDGSVGAACTHQGFDILLWNSEMKKPETRHIDGENSASWKHSCV